MIFGEYETPIKNTTHFIRISFLVSFKKGYCVFSFQTHFKILSRKHVFASFFTDHSPIFFSFEKGNYFVHGRGLWKSLISDPKYIESMKKHIYETLYSSDNQHITDKHEGGTI